MESSLPRVSDLVLPIRLLHPQARTPSYARAGDAGADLCIASDLTLEPGERALVGTGIAVAVPEGCVGLVHARSGLAHRHGLAIVNAPGVIDSGYRGEVMLNLINLDPREPVTLSAGDRIAQLVIQQVPEVHWVEVDSLPGSDRGETGHGASGGFAAGS